MTVSELMEKHPDVKEKFEWNDRDFGVFREGGLLRCSKKSKNHYFEDSFLRLVEAANRNLEDGKADI